ncbi:COAC2 [Scenedesmus sp. PABB004]|nr:COAC2 [Scenedesmus sp. PABB004]
MQGASHGAEPRESTSGAVRRRLQALPAFARELIAGGAAGALGKTSVAPLERAKIIFQTRGGNLTVAGVLQYIWKHEGVAGLFKGNAASVLRIVPYAAIHFGLYEHFRRVITPRLAHPGSAAAGAPVYDLLAGSASGAAAVLATYPLDLVRTRLAWATEAPAGVRARRGFIPRASAHAARAPPPRGGPPDRLPPPARRRGAPAAAAGAGAGAPRWLARRRAGIVGLLACTAREEGVVGLYRGVAPTLLGILPYAGLKFYVYNAMKTHYRAWTARSGGSGGSGGGGGGGGDRWERRQRAGAPGPPPEQSAREQRELLAERAELRAQLPVAQQPLPEQQQQQQQQQLQQPPPVGEKLPIAVSLVAGSLAGLVSQSVTYPLDVIRRQLQVAHLQRAASLREVIEAEVRAAAGGAGATGGGAGGPAQAAAAAAPAGGGQAAPPAKRSGAGGLAPASRSGGGGAAGGGPPRHGARALRLAPRLAPGLAPAGARAGSSARAPAAPAPPAEARPSMAGVTRALYAEGGLRAFFRGLSLNYIKVVPSTAIGFTVYDALKAQLGLASSL